MYARAPSYGRSSATSSEWIFYFVKNKTFKNNSIFKFIIDSLEVEEEFWFSYYSMFKLF